MKCLIPFVLFQLSCAAPEWRLKEVPPESVSRLELKAESIKRATVLIESFGAPELRSTAAKTKNKA
jgi:hypothetical protein